MLTNLFFMIISLYINSNTSHNQILILTIRKKSIKFKKYKIGNVGKRTPSYRVEAVTLPARPHHKNEKLVFENGIYSTNTTYLIYIRVNDVMVR